jgi:hypothetical protein
VVNLLQKQPRSLRRASPRRFALAFSAGLGCALALSPFAVPAGEDQAVFARLEPADTPGGYLARLLINEAAFPGERGWVSEPDSQTAMYQILWVLHSRIHEIPKGYTQPEVAGVHSEDIIDVITGTGGRRQCQGFYRNERGQFVTDVVVEERINHMLVIANSGGKPGRFSTLLNYAQDLARIYFEKGMQGVDRYAALKHIDAIPVTGRAYSWMTDIDSYHPGGNFVTITDAYEGSFAGNRFFTLRKTPR